MEKVIAVAVAENASCIVKYYEYSSSYDMCRVLDSLSKDVLNPNKLITIYVINAVDVSEYYEDGVIRPSIDERQLAIDELGCSQGMPVVLENTRFSSFKYCVVDSDFAEKDCNVFFKSESYHNALSSITDGMCGLLIVEDEDSCFSSDNPTYNLGETDWVSIVNAYAQYSKYASKRDKTNLTLSIHRAIIVSDETYKQLFLKNEEDDYRIDVSMNYFNDKWGTSEWVDFDNKHYIVDFSNSCNILSI